MLSSLTNHPTRNDGSLILSKRNRDLAQDPTNSVVSHMWEGPQVIMFPTHGELIKKIGKETPRVARRHAPVPLRPHAGFEAVVIFRTLQH